MKTRDQIIDWFVLKIANLSNAKKSEIDISLPFNHLGLSSLDLVQILGEFNSWMEEEFSPTLFFEYPDIESFANHIANPDREKNNDVYFMDTDIESCPVSVIGMSCKFPGASSLREFWNLLKEGNSGISTSGSSRWTRKGEFPPYAGYIEDPFSFDAGHFGISKAEEKEMDPQQKLLMELSWHAIEDAGYAPEELRGKRVGVFVGISTSDFSLERILKSQKAGIFTGTGMAHSIAANRISYFYDFKGPSFAIDTACSSSLVAMDQALQALQRHACDMVLVGGVNLLLSPYLFESFYKAGMLSPEGQCKTFSDDANGYVRGEGGGFIVLKRESDAINDKNRIYCNLISTAVNQDGNTNNITAPNGKAQQLVIREAISRAAITPDEIDFIETHGTGTSLGDPIEYESLRRVFEHNKSPVGIGALKTMIGHLEASAGIAGAIKTCLSLHHGLFPKNLNFKKLNSKIIRTSSNLEILLEQKILDPGRKYRVGVSSFGFGGTNSHAIFESFKEKKMMIPLKKSRDPEVFGIYLSASSRTSLEKFAEQLFGYSSHESFSQFCSHLFYHKSRLPHRLFFKAENWQDFRGKCELIARGDFGGVNYRELAIKRNLKTVMLFTGQGSQYPGMGKTLYHSSTYYRKIFNECLNLFQGYFEENLSDIIFPMNDDSRIYQTCYAQPLLFCCGYSLYKLYEHLGITPSMTLGHSLGEIIAVAAAKMMSLEDACKLVYYRASLMQTTRPGSMLAVYKSLEELKNYDLSDVDIAAVNGPALIVFSGAKKQISDLKSLFDKEQIKSKLLSVEQAFHSRLMDSMIGEFRTAIMDIKYKPGKFKVLSASSLELLEPETLDAEFWCNHLRKPTLFHEGMKLIEEQDFQVMLEVGVNPALIPMYEMFRKKEIISATSLERRKTDDVSLEVTLGKMFVHGIPFERHPFSSKKPRQGMDLPQTTFNHNKKTAVPRDQDKIMKKNKDNLRSELKDIMVKELGINRELIEDEGSLMNLGADSLTLLNILEMINDVYQVNIPVSSIFSELDTLNKIVNFIHEQTPAVESGSEFESLDMGFVQIPDNGALDINGLIQRQLDIIQQQLQILGKTSPIEKPRLREDKSLSGKGVLGNFSTQARMVKEEMKGDQKEYLENLISSFTAKTRRSKEHNQRYRNCLADNRVSAGFRPNLKEAVYPIIFKSAKGSHFTDIDGNDYVDFTMGFGVNLFGHSPDFIQKKIAEQLETGMAVGPQAELAGPVAELFCRLTGMERVAFVNSGTEAVMTAIRLARAGTGKNKVVLFEGSYHGHSDVVLGRRNRKNETLPVAAGIPRGLIDDLIVLDYDSDESLEFIRKNGKQLAAVIVEGVQSRFPEVQPREFLLEIRKITEQNGIAMIVDEVINGFRSKIGGVQEDFGFKADIAAYGKIIGGGLPIGALAGKKEFLNFIDGGYYRFGDDSFPQNEMTFFAGTFCKHPLAMAACYEVLKKLDDNGKQILEQLNEKTTQMAAMLNHFFDEHDVPIKIVCYGSLFRFKFEGNMDWLFILLNHLGIYIWEGRNMFISSAHTDEDIRLFVEKTMQAVNELISIGYIPAKNSDVITRIRKQEIKSYAFTESHRRFSELLKKGEDGNRAGLIALAVELEGNLDFNSLRNAARETMHRHESFSTRFFVDENRIETGHENTCTVQEIDFSGLDSPESHLHEWMLENASKLFDLQNETPVRIHALRIGSSKTILSLVCHHLVMDGLSIAFLIDELSKRYSNAVGEKTQKLMDVIPFSEYLADYETELGKILNQKDFWLGQYREKYERVAKLETEGFQAARISRIISKEQYKKIRMFGYKHKSSLLQTMISYFSFFMRKRYEIKDLCLGIPTAGHQSIKRSMIGNCVNIIPLRVKCSDKENPFELIPEVKELQLDAFKNCEFPYPLLRESLQNDPIQISFNIEPVDELPKFGKLKAKLVSYPISACEFALSFNIMKVGEELEVEMDYLTGVFSESEASQFIDDYLKLLETIK